MRLGRKKLVVMWEGEDDERYEDEKEGHHKECHDVLLLSPAFGIGLGMEDVKIHAIVYNPTPTLFTTPLQTSKYLHTNLYQGEYNRIRVYHQISLLPKQKTTIGPQEQS